MSRSLSKGKEAVLNLTGIRRKLMSRVSRCSLEKDTIERHSLPQQQHQYRVNTPAFVDCRRLLANMDDPELEAIRRARMAELQGGRGGGGGPSSGGYASGMGRGGGGMGEDDGKQQEQMAAQEEMKRQALSTILDPEARERCK
jgi:hypothetical protein